MTTKRNSVWLPRVLFESALIVGSILAALWFDQLSEDREDEEIQQLALLNFAAEIRQNTTRMDDIAPFNQGLRQVVARHYRDNDIQSVDEFVNMVGSYSPARLHATAWETALATGSLARMDYKLVAALSLTYSLQNRYEAITGSGLRELTSPQNLSDRNFRLAIYNAIRYLDDVIVMEANIGVTYGEAMAVVNEALIDNGIELPSELEVSTAELAHP